MPEACAGENDEQERKTMVSLVRRDNRKDSHVKTLRSFLLSHHPPLPGGALTLWFKSRLSNPNRMRLDFGAQASGTHPSRFTPQPTKRNAEQRTRAGTRRKATVGYLVDRPANGLISLITSQEDGFGTHSTYCAGTRRDPEFL